MTREFAFAFFKMKLALVLQTLAIFTVTTLVRCAPFENQSNEIAERDAAEENPYCVKFFEDTYLAGEMAVMCIQFKTCWPAPFYGVSSVAPDPNYHSYCKFYSSNDCSGQFIGISSGQTILDFLNWNDNISSYVCDHDKKLNSREDATTFTIAQSTNVEHNGIAERDTEFCTHFYEHIYFQGINTVLCDKQKVCWPGPSFGASSIKPNPGSCGYCQFYKKPGCAGDFIGISTTDTIADLSNFGIQSLDWNDVIKSYWCDEKLNCGAASSTSTNTVSTKSVPQVKDTEFGSSTELSERDVSDISALSPTQDGLQTSTNRIDVNLYTDTHFNGVWLALSAQVNACVKITKSDGTGHNFDMSSARMKSHTTTSDGQNNVAYCKFYQSKDCEANTWAFTIGNNEDAPDLNDISKLKFKGPIRNVNDKIWSTYCIWDVEVRRRGVQNPLWSYGSIKMDRLPKWILDMGMDITCHFNSAIWCDYPLFTSDSWHDIPDVTTPVHGYWCEWRQTK
ncbi:hypothetical protein EG327_011498 [Venturia inaequalis]|uniref:Uncharacterized protein n=1 Tax=Venturia inaequalis TaxID=5025 RepID=A0A8H3VRH0_VENIN|nr:hypothetical protein EG327_011498 [Venturia inaequalis]